MAEEKTFLVRDQTGNSRLATEREILDRAAAGEPFETPSSAEQREYSRFQSSVLEHTPSMTDEFLGGALGAVDTPTLGGASWLLRATGLASPEELRKYHDTTGHTVGSVLGMLAPTGGLIGLGGELFKGAATTLGASQRVAKAVGLIGESGLIGAEGEIAKLATEEHPTNAAARVASAYGTGLVIGFGLGAGGVAVRYLSGKGYGALKRFKLVSNIDEAQALQRALKVNPEVFENLSTKAAKLENETAQVAQRVKEATAGMSRKQQLFALRAQAPSRNFLNSEVQKAEASLVARGWTEEQIQLLGPLETLSTRAHAMRAQVTQEVAEVAAPLLVSVMAGGVFGSYVAGGPLIGGIIGAVGGITAVSRLGKKAFNSVPAKAGTAIATKIVDKMLFGTLPKKALNVVGAGIRRSATKGIGETKGIGDLQESLRDDILLVDPVVLGQTIEQKAVSLGVDPTTAAELGMTQQKISERLHEEVQREQSEKKLLKIANPLLNPLGIMVRINDGTVTAEDIEVLRTYHPKTWALVAGRAEQQLKTAIGHQRRKLEKVLGKSRIVRPVLMQALEQQQAAQTAMSRQRSETLATATQRREMQSNEV